MYYERDLRSGFSKTEKCFILWSSEAKSQSEVLTVADNLFIYSDHSQNLNSLKTADLSERV